MLFTLLTVCMFLLNSLALLILYIRSQKKKNIRSYAFFHPYCNAGGGGERVLWTAIQTIQERYPNYKYVVYTGDTEATPDEILATARRRFSIELPQPVQFVYLRTRPAVEARYYPMLTLVLQSLASMIVGLEALLKFTPDVYIDTMGYAFTLPLFKLFAGCRTVSYVHYPTISTDMLQSVESGRQAFNNRGAISSSVLLTRAKLVYYNIFSCIYGFFGSFFCDVTMVNSSWTLGHINKIWGTNSHLVYPPCSVEDFQSLESTADASKEFRIVSLAQFRPEKDHMLMLKAINELKHRLSSDEQFKKIKLVLIGSCRDSEDQQRIEDLKLQARFLHISENVEFLVDIKYAELRVEMQKASAAIHAMYNEHFGIAVVECMAAGLLTVANDSGGPKLDIVENGCGFRATTAEQYAQAFDEILRMSVEERREIGEKAKKSANRFTEEKFKRLFLEVIENEVENVDSSCLLSHTSQREEEVDETR